MSKYIKRTFFVFSPYECAAVEEYLELMSQKGWLLLSIKGNFFKFKKIKPKNIKYSVDVLHKASIFDHKDSDVALEYREYCKAAGWNYVCQIGKIQIFYTQDYNKAISIHTDEEEKFKSVFKASLCNMGIQFLLTLMFIFNLYIQLFLGDARLILAYNMGILSIVTTIAFIFINTIGFISFLLWVIKVRARLRKGKGMNYSNYKQVIIKNILRNSYGLIILFILLKLLIFDNIKTIKFKISVFIIMCIPIIITIYARKLINKKRYSKHINMSISIGSVIVTTYVVIILVVAIILFNGETLQNKIPISKINLTIEDFGFTGNKDESYMYFDKSIIAQIVDYSSGNDDNYLKCTILESDYPLVIKFYENRLLSKLNIYGTDLKEKKTNLPDNIVVYVDSEKRTFVLMSEDKVVEIRKDFLNITEEEFLNMVYKKLF